jgi:monoamine oxidase
METTTLILGGGLAGLSLADHLAQDGADFLLVEAQDRLGGRILTQDIGGGAFDLGPAWFWPGQPRMERLVKRLGVTVFEQYSEGAIAFQDSSGAVSQNRGFASMRGSLRIAGGMNALIAGLQMTLPSANLRLNTKATSIERTDHGIRAQVTTLSGAKTITARRVVLALPPRIIAETITFAPALRAEAIHVMEQIPTWMAGHAKIIAVYDQPHWRTAGMSGDAMSQKGPMVEIHDASPVSGGPFALFGFVGFPPEIRAQHPEQILALARQQLVDLFGPQMANPVSIHMQDWAQNPMIATQRDSIALRAHPDYGLPKQLSDIWEGNVVFASTEMGRDFGGFLEGALEAAEQANANLRARTTFGTKKSP